MKVHKAAVAASAMAVVLSATASAASASPLRAAAPSGPAYATDGPSLAAACDPLFTSTAKSSFPVVAGSDHPQLDVVQADLHNTDSTLYAVITVADMEEGASAVPPGGTANEYYLTWTYSGTEYFVSAEVDAIGDDYNYGTYSTTTGYSSTGTATGTIVDGTDGTITMSLPLSGVGAPAAGDTLLQPAVATRVLVGVPTVGGDTASAGSFGPTNDYVLGETCSTNGQPGSDGGAGVAGGSVPETPWALALPVVGLAAAGVMVRRRRRAATTA